MCLIVLAWRVHPRWPLLLLAHRDEFRDRPSAALSWWQQPEILAGRDLRAGGSWLGVNRTGQIAALTNVRRGPACPATLSRGVWVPRALSGHAATLAEQLHGEAHLSGAFNLLHGDVHELRVWHSPSGRTEELVPGVHALSNAALNTPWPKVRASRARMTALLPKFDDLDDAALWAVGAIDQLPADTELPDTGIGPDWERRLAPPLILGPEYGTVSRTLLAIGANGRLRMVEQQLDEHGHVQSQVRAAFQVS